MRASVASSQQTTPKRLDILSPVDTGHHTPGLGHTQSASFQWSFELSEEISTWVQAGHLYHRPVHPSFTESSWVMVPHFL